MTSRLFDTIVIGAGPGGEGAAMKLAKAGQRVAVIEAHSSVGGGCTHWGTIPSKALRHSIQTLADYRGNPLFQGIRSQLEVEFPDLLRAADGVINDQVRTRYRYYQRNRVEVVFGQARFTAPDRIEVLRPGGLAEASAPAISLSPPARAPIIRRMSTSRTRGCWTATRCLNSSIPRA